MLAYFFGKTSNSAESLNAAIEGDPLYRNNKLGRIQEGLTFFIHGKIVRNGERFLIDFGLENANRDIALCIVARVSNNSLGRRARIKNNWIPEETDAASGFHLKSGTFFEIQVFFTVENILIALNGVHIAKFAHRLPYHEIHTIEVRGDIKHVHVNRSIVTDYPTRPHKTPRIARLADRFAENSDSDDMESSLPSTCSGDEVQAFLALPYYATFERGFFDVGYSVGVKGRVRFSAHMFRVALQVGQTIWPQPTIALQLEFRFNRQRNGETGEPTIVRNSFTNGKWSGEIKTELLTGLRPGAEFHLVMGRSRKSFEIFMNDKPLIDHPYMINPKYVDTCLAEGDIRLFSVDIERH